MPQIRCPSCGTSINLEARRETDLSLILNSLRSGPKTFTQLLRATRLPRKTLSLRLNDLVNSEAIIKDGGYRLNEALPFDLRRKMNMKRTFQFSRKNMMLTLLILCMGVLLAQAYGQYMFAPPTPPPTPKPTITETFKVNIIIHDVTDLCAWQVKVVFDPNALIVTNVVEGPFLQGVDNPVTTVFVVRTHIVEGIFEDYADGPFTIVSDEKTSVNSVLIGCCLLGDLPGVSGSGILATITFGVVGQGGHDLQLEDALLLDGNLSEIQGYMACEVQQG